MNHINALALCSALSLACGTTETGESCPTVTSATTTSSTTTEPSYALQISTCATFPSDPAAVIGGDMFCLAINALEPIEIRALSIDIQGASLTHDLLVGSASTTYFYDLQLEEVMPDSSRTVLAGPIQLPASLPASSRDSGIFSFSDAFTLEPGGHALRITSMHDRPEDAPNEYMTVTAHYYFAWINDGASPFNDGDVRDTSGNPISLDRIFWMPDELLTPAFVIEPVLD